ncbi:MAG TPA: CAP domain-containing protein [Steroidobacteraceae bacterium]|nr:CAP domain-containing protein [Steroidobacteraceae bacterium]
MTRTLLRIALLLSAAAPFLAAATPLDTLNSVRRQGCEDKPGVKFTLAHDAALDGVALQMSRGARLADAIDATHFHARLSASIAISGAADQAALARLIAQRFCTEALNPDFQRAGSAERGRDTWIVLATPFNLPVSKDAPAIRMQALKLVNQARATARKCGSTSFGAARPLTLDSVLNTAALNHSTDMAARGHMAHQGSDGSNVAQRVARVGYAWRRVGENVAAGAPDIDEVVRGWIGSPAHCVNLMNPDFTAMGIAYAVNPATEDGIYWTQVFATPR